MCNLKLVCFFSSMCVLFALSGYARDVGSGSGYQPPSSGTINETEWHAVTNTGALIGGPEYENSETGNYMYKYTAPVGGAYYPGAVYMGDIDGHSVDGYSTTSVNGNTVTDTYYDTNNPYVALATKTVTKNPNGSTTTTVQTTDGRESYTMTVYPNGDVVTINNNIKTDASTSFYTSHYSAATGETVYYNYKGQPVAVKGNGSFSWSQPK